MEEESFKESFNWKKLTIDAVNTVIATAIGLVIGLAVDKWQENKNNAEQYQKIITATINNLNNYADQIENLQSWAQASVDQFAYILSDDYPVSDPDSVQTDFCQVFYNCDFMQQDRWIEENFITNGNFIENTDIRLKIGNVYSLIDLSRNSVDKLSQLSDKAYKQYLDCVVAVPDTKKAMEKTWEQSDFIKFYADLSPINENLKYYLANIKELIAQISEKADADPELLKELKESSDKINKTLLKERQ